MAGITIQGTVPYPPNADATQVLDLARELTELVQALNLTSTQVTATASTATSTWTGVAADTFGVRMQDRASTISTTARTLGRAAPILQTYAAAIVSTQAAYSAAAAAEQAARAGLPWTAAALAAALAAEGAAVTTLQGAGFACGAGLGGIVAQIVATRYLTGRSGGGTTQQPVPAGGAPTAEGGWDEIVSDIWDWIFGTDTSPSTAPGQTPGQTPGTAPLPLPDRDGDGIPDWFDIDLLQPGTDATATPGVDTGQMPQFPAGATTDQRYETYAAYFREHGVDLDQLGEGERAILGLRDANSTTVNNGTGTYNDRIVVAWTENGVRHVEEFTANTEPSAQYDAAFRGRTINGVRYARGGSIQGADADGDGRRDLGRLPTGVYEFQRSTSTVVGGDNVLRGVRAVDLERDVNHDGVFDATDGTLVTRPEALTDRQSILFHRGSANDTDSAGCQTFAGRADWGNFWNSLGPANGVDRNPQQRFTYVLHEVARDDQPAPVLVPTP